MVLRHHETLERFGDDEVLGLQAAKRFADGHPAHAQLGRQLSLLEFGAVTKPSAHDGCLQLCIYAVRQSLALNAVQIASSLT